MKILRAGHQGEVLFLIVGEIRQNYEDLPLLEHKSYEDIVIQVGEGLHQHVIPYDQAQNLQVRVIGEVDSVKEMLLKVEEPVNVVHEEHRALTLTPGFWVARTQREQFNGIVRPVID